jgi:hypothetical protein
VSVKQLSRTSGNGSSSRSCANEHDPSGGIVANTTLTHDQLYWILHDTQPGFMIQHVPRVGKTTVQLISAQARACMYSNIQQLPSHAALLASAAQCCVHVRCTSST